MSACIQRTEGTSADMASRRLTDSAELYAADARRPWWRRPNWWGLFGGLVSLTGAALLICSGLVIWSWRTDSTAPSWVHAALAITVVVLPIPWLIATARRDGADMLPLFAVILPVMAWMVACVFRMLTA